MPTQLASTCSYQSANEVRKLLAAEQFWFQIELFSLIGAILTQAAQESCAGIAGGSLNFLYVISAVVQEVGALALSALVGAILLIDFQRAPCTFCICFTEQMRGDTDRTRARSANRRSNKHFAACCVTWRAISHRLCRSASPNKTSDPEI
jgi:hypothetical protein